MVLIFGMKAMATPDVRGYQGKTVQDYLVETASGAVGLIRTHDRGWRRWQARLHR